MAARRSALSRAVDFFRNGNLDEARVAHTLVNEVMAKRMAQVAQTPGPKTVGAKRGRKSKSAQTVEAPTSLAASAN